MNKKFKKITAILMSALIISSVATLTACTDTGTSDSNKATNNSSDTTKNSSEPTNNSSEPTKNSSEPTKNSSEPTKNSSETTKNSSEPTKNSSETTNNSSETTNNSFETTNNSSETANNSSEATRILTDSFENKGGIYVEGVFPEGAMLSAFFFNKEALYHLPITDNLHWYEYWFETNTVAKLSKFYHGGFSLDIFSADWESLNVKTKVFVPFEKPDCHIIYFDTKNNPREIPSEYINGKYIFSLDPADFEEEQYNAFYICSYGEADPNAKPVQQTLTDEKTGITVSGKIPPDTQLTVVDYSNLNTLASNEVTTPGLYYITLINGHKQITPSSAFTITIPGEAGNKVGYYHAGKFIDRVWNAVEEYSAESVDPDPAYNTVVDENDTRDELTYLENSYSNNSYTITTKELGLFGVGTKDKLNPEYLCRVDFYQPSW